MGAARPDARLIELFTDLVRLDGPSGRERPVADYVRGVLGRLGLPVLEDDAGDRGEARASGNLVCRVAGGGALALVAHLDTVLPTAGLEPVVGGDRVTGRGAPILGADNRAGVAAILWAVERLAAAGPPPPVTAAFTVREETDLAGARRVALPGTVRMAVVLDSSLRPGHYIRRAYGARRFRAEVRGRASHAALAPERGVHAVRAAARAVAALPTGRVGADTTLNVGTLRGGTALNVVPERCVAEGEIRSLARADVERWTALVEAAFRRETEAVGAELRFDSAWEFEPYELPMEAEVCRRVEAALGRLGHAPRAATSAGGSDANALNARGLPAVNAGIGAQNPHAADEFILLEDLAAAGALAVELARGG